MAIIYISHRIEEIKKIADRVTVIRDGEVIQSCGVDEVEIDGIVKVMVGKEMEDRYPKLKVKIGREILRVNNLSWSGRIRDVSFEVRKGEIIGLTGLSGSGRRDLAKTLFGINKPFEGTMKLGTRTFRTMTPHIAKKHGLCYVSGIASEEGLIANATISENITLANLKRVSSRGFIKPEVETELARDLIERLEIGADEKEIVQNLSGESRRR